MRRFAKNVFQARKLIMSGKATRQLAATRAPAPESDERAGWYAVFHNVRSETERRAALLSAEDQMVQSMADASPTKWHRAHTTWFFEQFVLVPHLKNYQVFDQDFAFLFNSYYVAAGPRHARPKRGLLTRPSIEAIAAYRAHVDSGVARLLDEAKRTEFPQIAALIELGLNHEQQHQELLITDILHAFAQNPMAPAYDPQWQWPSGQQYTGFAELIEGIY